MKTRYDGCAATEKGVLVGLRIESGAAVQFHTVCVPWDDLLGDEVAIGLDRACRRELARKWSVEGIPSLF